MNATLDLFPVSTFDQWVASLREKTRIAKIQREDRNKRFDACATEIDAFVASKKWTHADYDELHGGVKAIWQKHGFSA
jgi:hypothetical protein